MKISSYKNNTKKTFYNSGMSLESIVAELNGSVTRDSLKEDSTAMACISILSGYLASMSLKLFEIRERDSIEVTNSLTDVLKRPNTLHNYFDLMKESLQEMFIKKEAFLLITTKSGKVTTLDLIENASLIQTTSGAYFVTGMVRNKVVNVNYDSVIHLRDSFDRFKSLENVISTKKSVNSLITKSYGSNLQNAIKGIITLEDSEGLSDEGKMNLKRAFNKVLASGEDNIAVLEDGMSFTSIQSGGVTSYSFAESQVKEILSILDDKIHQVFNVPKVLTSIADGSYNLSENQKSLFIESLLPLIKMIESEFTYKLLTSVERERYYFRINYESILRGDYASRVAGYNAALQGGWTSRAEVRAKENLPYIKGTDDLLMSLNYVPNSEWKEYTTKRDTGEISEEIKEKE